MKREDRSTRITLVLDVAMFKALKAAAKRQEKPYSKIVRRALAEYLGVPDSVEYGGYREREEKEGEAAAA